MDLFKSTVQLMLQVPMVDPVQMIQAEQGVMEVQAAVEEQVVQERKMGLVLQEQYLVEQAPIMVEMVELELLETILPGVEEMPQELLWQVEGEELDSSLVQEEEVEHLQLTEFLEMELQVVEVEVLTIVELMMTVLGEEEGVEVP